MPKISVIVPVYKVEKYIYRCVDSILSQTFEDFELILVDDGSPDNCGTICEDYAAKDSRIRVIHQQNGGLSAARNRGIDWVFQNSDTQWLAFVDSDDWVHPKFLQLLLEAVESTGCTISACGFFRSSGESIPEDVPAEPAAMEAEDYYCGSFHEGITAVAWNKLYHRDLFRTLRYPVGKLHEDEFTTYRAIYEAGRIAVTPVRLYGYYYNANGIMNAQWSSRRMHMLEGFTQQIQFAREQNHSRLLAKAADSCLYSSCEQLEAAPKEYKKQLRQYLRRALQEEKKLGKGWKQLHWAYEAAWPCRPLWWLVSKVRKHG